MQPSSGNDLVHTVAMSQSVPKRVLVCEELEPDLLTVDCGGAQLTRALINLIANANEAMQGAGVLTLKTENVYLDKPLKGYKTIKKGEYVRLEICDTGCGIKPEVLDKIFDPFFTTKKMDHTRGSGLGLSVVNGIVEDHHGYLTVESTVARPSPLLAELGRRPPGPR